MPLNLYPSTPGQRSSGSTNTGTVSWWNPQTTQAPAGYKYKRIANTGLNQFTLVPDPGYVAPSSPSSTTPASTPNQPITSGNQADYFQNVGRTAASLADPFAEQRPQYQQQLSRLMQNPGEFASSPAYKFAFDQGMEAVNRTAAAKGQLGSGNRLLDLTKFGQGLAGQQYFQQADLLGLLAGAKTSSPAAAGQSYAWGAGKAADAFNNAEIERAYRDAMADARSSGTTGAPQPAPLPPIETFRDPRSGTYTPQPYSPGYGEPVTIGGYNVTGDLTGQEVFPSSYNEAFPSSYTGQDFEGYDDTYNPAVPLDFGAGSVGSDYEGYDSSYQEPTGGFTPQAGYGANNYDPNDYTWGVGGSERTGSGFLDVIGDLYGDFKSWYDDLFPSTDQNAFLGVRG